VPVVADVASPHEGGHAAERREPLAGRDLAPPAGQAAPAVGVHPAVELVEVGTVADGEDGGGHALQ
jgi:hypothetical protein